MACANHAANNDEYVVEQRPEGREKKQAMREQDGGDNPPYIEEDLRRQQNAGQVDRQLHLRRRETMKHPAHKLRRKDFRENGAGNHHRSHHRDDDGESLLRVGFALLREKPRIDRDECNRSRAPGHDVVEPVRQGEGGDVGVGLRPGAKSVGNICLADVADHPRQHHRRHQQQRGRKSRVLVRRAEEP